jgi:hypothetical protein
MPEPGWDESLRIYEKDKESIKAQLRTTKNPEGSTPFALLESDNLRIIKSDETGAQMVRILKFIEEAGGEVLDNQVIFMRLHLKKMPEVARKRIKAYTDDIYKRTFDKFASNSEGDEDFYRY